jgi:hypothetical protein
MLKNVVAEEWFDVFVWCRRGQVVRAENTTLLPVLFIEEDVE